MSLSNGLEKYPKLRFPGYSKPWNREKLSDFTTRIVRKNKNNETDLPLTISSKDGLVDQVSFFNKTVASKDMSGYYLIRNGEFAYNKSYSVGYNFGSIKRLDRYPMGALSTLYICFELNKHNSDFIKTYFDSLKWYKEIYLISAEGARNHGLLNIPTEDFFDSLHYIPSGIEEQEKIADFLMLIDQKVQKQQQLVELLKKYKKGDLKEIFNKDSNWNKNTKWKKTKLKNVGLIQTGTTPSTSVTEYYGNEYFWVTPSDILSKEILTTTKMLSEKGINKGRRIPANSVLATCIASIGKNTILRTVGSCNQQINSITPNENYDLEFLYYSICYNEPLMHEMAGSGGMEILNKQTFSELELYFPPIKEQRYFGTLLATFEESIEHEEKLINELHKTKQSLLQQLFI